MTKLKIRVTKEILEKSKYCGMDQFKPLSENCAIALAVRGVFPEANVGTQSMSLTENEENIQLPLEAQYFIGAFDAYIGCPEKRTAMPELEFEVEIPDSVIEKIDIESLRPLLVNHKNLELV